MNILLCNHPAETLGSFWYIQHEVFEYYSFYFKLTFLVMQLLMCIYVSLMLYDTASILNWMDSNVI